MSRMVQLLCSLLVLAANAAIAQPANDLWANRTPITMLPFQTDASLVGSGVEPTDPLPMCVTTQGSIEGNVWFSYTTGAMPEILTLRVADFQVVALIAVYSGTPGAFRIASGGCARAGGFPNNAQLAGVRLEANTAYSILVGALNPPGSTVDFRVANAVRYDVTKTADTFDGTCDADCSLREAITANVATAGAVMVPAGTYTLTRMGDSEDANATGDLDVLNDIAIYGAGIGQTIIDANRIDRVFDTPTSNQESPTLILRDLTITRGNALALIGPRRGGGIRNEPSSPGFIGLERVALVDNRALEAGGGLVAGSAGTIRESRITMNDTDSAAGGILFFNPNDRVFELETSTIDNNEGGNSGGGIQSQGNLRIVNSTISGNRVTQVGGGLRINNGPFAMSSSTVASNMAGIPTDTSNGGGLYLDSGQTYVLFNNILADNSAGDCLVFGGTLSTRYNLVEDSQNCAFAGPGDAAGDAQLAALADNGGPTPTHAIPFESLAVDRGDPAGCTAPDGSALATDQRGAGFARVIDGRCDKGAFEQGAKLLFSDGFE